ncbi:MAG: hypothetical protein RL226_1878 [Bacteroidota bacterium]|jgi:hypothetical protein
MKVYGFTFIRNAVKYDYPVVEAILSILPICDSVIVAVGNSDDGTRELIASIHPTKVVIVDTVWDDSLREGGRVLAVETDKAYAAIPDDADWAFYIQGDEVMHERYLDPLRKAMEEHLHNPLVDGLLFKYEHFYGSYDYVGASSKWYRNEIRVIRKDAKIYSFRDAQGFRKGENKKLNVKPANATMYHYGWVKDPRAMQLKQENFHKMWHDDQWVEQHVVKATEFDYHANVRSLKRFEGSHPKVMQARVDRVNWKFDVDVSFNRDTFKDKAKALAYAWFGLDFNYKNYRKV